MFARCVSSVSRCSGPQYRAIPAAIRARVFGLSRSPIRSPGIDQSIAAAAGSALSSALDRAGAARVLGLSDHALPPIPELGTTASKRSLPKPFDRSVYERLFAVLSGGAGTELGRDAEEVLDEEIRRTAAPWQLGTEDSRVVMALGAEAGRALEPAELLRPTAAQVGGGESYRARCRSHRDPSLREPRRG